MGIVASHIGPVVEYTTGAATVASVSGENVLSFSTSGSFHTRGKPLTARMLLVGGGGGSSINLNGAGGGGGGGMIDLTGQAVAGATTYTVTVGTGGSGGTTAVDPGYGNSSSFGALATAWGGGKPARGVANATYPGLPTAAGNFGTGGGGNGQLTGAGVAGAIGGFGHTGTPDQGSNGGVAWNNSATAKPSGGGGGGGGDSGAVGASAADGVGGNGGNGTQSNITGTNTFYAGGGGGGCRGGSGSGAVQGTGGSGGGAAASFNGVLDGTDGLGGGAGGAASGRTGTAGAGGNGVVIVRWVGPTPTAI